MPPPKNHGAEMHRGFFLPVKAFPPAPNGPGTGGGRCHATYLCGERFNSRPPRGGRLCRQLTRPRQGAFQSTPSARRATCPAGQKLRLEVISIHALREEGDALTKALTVCRYQFQSTPSARRATHDAVALLMLVLDFNPRPPRGGRRTTSGFKSTTSLISIHALREEGDRGAAAATPGGECISIHALREEGDPKTLGRAGGRRDFNPRPPRGGRLEPASSRHEQVRISIHALREEGDLHGRT